jgi:iron complex transport system ATP-binding protein
MVLRLAEVGVERGGVKILEGVSWEVRRGERWAILGPNGSGKTSLLRVLTADLWPTRGEIELFGKRLGRADWRELRRAVGWVGAALWARVPDDELAVETVVGGGRGQWGIWEAMTAEEREVAMRLLDEVGAGVVAGRPWGVLSQGERQRVLMARARRAGAELLFLDEPCAGLDPAAREDLLEFLEGWGASYVMVTHHVEEVGREVGQILTMRVGRVFGLGVKEELMREEILAELYGREVELREEGGVWTARYWGRRGVKS